MNRDTVRQAVNVVALIALLVVSYLSNALPINGLTQTEIADRFDILFIPAGYAFSIWGVIYLGLIAFTLYQALPSQRENPRLRRIGLWFAASCAANVAWLFIWHYERFVLSLLPMGALAATLLMVVVRLREGREPVSTAERWAVHVPFSIYLGWVTVAAVVNVTSALDAAGWGGWGISDVVWTLALLVVVEAVAAVVSFTSADVAYQAALIWAVTGIGVEQSDNTVVSVAAWVTASVLVLILIGGLLVRRARRLRAARAQD